MKFIVRYGLAALLMITAMVLLIPPLAVSLVEQWSENDVETRSVLAFNTALDEFTDLLNEHDTKKIVSLFENGARRAIARRGIL
jgi:hypothetical protein